MIIDEPLPHLAGREVQRRPETVGSERAVLGEDAAPRLLATVSFDHRAADAALLTTKGVVLSKMGYLDLLRRVRCVSRSRPRRLDRLVRIGSFSKVLSAATRCGQIAARPDWVKALADLRIARSIYGGGRGGGGGS